MNYPVTRPLIGLTGHKGAGKDTVAGILKRLYGYERQAWADALKLEVYEAFGWALYTNDEPDTALLPIKHGDTWAVTLVNRTRLVELASFSWFMTDHGYVARGPVLGDARGEHSNVYLHRYLMETPAGQHVDHQNGNTLDNRIANLRPCSQKDNMRSSIGKALARSGYRGVKLDTRTGRYVAKIRVDGKSVHIGVYDTATDAGVAYDVAARGFFGEFAVTNAEIQARKALTLEAFTVWSDAKKNDETSCIRPVFQAWGTEYRRNLCDENYWTRQLQLGPGVVVTDCRFPNEVEAIRKAGGVLWRIDRPGHTGDGHASEQFIDTLPVAFAVPNETACIPCLEDTVKHIYTETLDMLRWEAVTRG